MGARIQYACIVCPLLLCPLLLVAWHPQRVLADDSEDQTIRAMLQVGLTDPAVAYVLARHELAAGNVSEQAKWTMRLMECHAQIALRDSQHSQEHWRRCTEVFDEFKTRQADNVRLPWLAWQAARCEFLQAQHALAQYLAAPANPQPREIALTQVREVTSQLNALDDDIQRRLPIAARQSLRGGTEAPAEQLHQLRVDVGLLQCEVLLIRARLYDRESRDRIAAATLVDAQADDVLARTNPEWPSREQLLVAQAEARLELSREAEALQTLEQLAASGGREATRTRAAMLAVEYLATHNATSRAQALLPLLADGPEQEIARVLLAIAELDSQPATAREQALSEIIDHAKKIGEVHGDYWRNRADALLVGSVKTSAGSGSNNALDFVRLEVRQLLSSGDTAGAIAKLLKHRDIEQAAGRGAAAIQLAAQAAALHQRDARWLSAADALEPTTLALANDDGAAESHLFVVALLQTALRSDASSLDLAKRYEQALVQQLQFWPDSPATNQPASWLAQWLTQQGRRAELLSLLLKRARQASSVEARRDSLQRWLEQLLAESQVAIRLSAIEELRGALADADWQGEKDVSQLTLIAGESFCVWSDRKSRQALQGQLMRLRIEDEPWKQIALAVELLDLARASQVNPAQRKAVDWQPKQLGDALRMGITSCLVFAIDQTPFAEHSAWAQILQMDESWAAIMLESSLPATQGLGYRIRVWNADRAGAVEGLRALATAHPRDADVLLQFALALVEGSQSERAESTVVLRRIIDGTAAGSELNLSARWRWLQNQVDLGEAGAVQTSAKLILATQPLADPVWRARFESLISVP